MSFIDKEKERIKYNYQGLILFGFLFFYFITVQSDITRHKVIFGSGIEAEPLSFITYPLILGIVILIMYLNSHLFWIKEQGKKVFILRKYDIIPIDRKEIYTAKFKIIIEYVIKYIIYSIFTYILALVFNSYKEINLLKNSIEIIEVFLLALLVLAIVLFINILQDKKTKKEI